MTKSGLIEAVSERTPHISKKDTEIVVNTIFGQNVLLAVRGAGDLCGEMAVLEQRRRSASVIFSAAGP